MPHEPQPTATEEVELTTEQLEEAAAGQLGDGSVRVQSPAGPSTAPGLVLPGVRGGIIAV